MKTNYDSDFYAWTQEQAALIRAGHLSELDAVNLLEEIEAMGRSEKRELQSRLVKLFSHLLKWKYQEARRGTSWQLTIKEQRIQAADCLADNPSLKSKLDEIISKAYELARIEAAKETGIKLATFPLRNPWTFAQAMESDFYPE
ncbi:TPA: DUF29 domain-containing protein [Enterobacter hormaechei subsp. steigerwaltii]|nr:DUF29 domain-containing protein [Enterobacter hormaechei subsp. steigerwaltii]